MTGLVFVDTNVLVYVRDNTEPAKQEIARQWMNHLWATARGRISQQVLNEYYSTVTRVVRRVLPNDRAREDVRTLQGWGPVVISSALFESAWRLQDRCQLSWWDALIVAAAQQAGCRWLLSEDLQDGQNFNGVTVANPFKHKPDALLKTSEP